MAKDKVTITLDRAKAEHARALVGASSTSEVIEIALERLLRAERLRRDIAAYRQQPQTDAEISFGLIDPDGDLTDDTDWEAVYADSAP